MIRTNIVPRHLQLLLRLYAVGLAFFFAFRVALLLADLDATEGTPLITILESFVMGLRFDVVVNGYLLVLPLVFLSITESLRLHRLWVRRSIVVYTSVVFGLAFLICAADIPYYEHFHSRITISSMSWTDSPWFMVSMIAQDVHYYPFIALLGVACALYAYLSRRLVRTWLLQVPTLTKALAPTRLRIILFSLCALGLLLVGIRGRVAAKSPIRWGTAYFSSSPFANQLGLNPVFTFARSYLDARSGKGMRLALMDDDAAIRYAQEHLRIAPDSTLASPIARRVIPTSAPLRANVVIVLMESLGAYRMGFCGSSSKLTPNLDSIAARSIVFDNLLSAGIHTFNGIYSTLFSFPALGSRHPMSSTRAMQPFTGIGRTLASNGYSTIFFTTHDDQFDNMGGFLRFNGFQRIVAQSDYPNDRVLSTLGVPDHFMFETAVKELNQLHSEGRPFLATLLTGSFHGPYILPPDIPFAPRSSNLKEQVLEYADWSIGRFVDLCSHQPWFDETIFVFVGDHGGTDRVTYAMSLDLNHTPAIFFGPGIRSTPTHYTQPAGQIDIYPTLMGMLNLSYVNNTMGIDLLRDRRPYLYFGADEDVGVIGDEYFLAIPAHGRQFLYRYRDGDPTDYLDAQRQVADSMRRYAFAMLQTTDWVVRNRLAGEETDAR